MRVRVLHAAGTERDARRCPTPVVTHGIWGVAAILAQVVGMALCGAEPPTGGPGIQIIAAGTDRALAWTAAYTTGTYHIEWSSDPVVGHWSHDYSSFRTIPAVGGTQSVLLPFFFRVAYHQPIIDLAATATLDVFSLVPRPLEATPTEAEGPWASVPPALEGAGIFWDGPRTGVCDFTVLESGLVYLACHFGYDGSTEGDWDETRWLEADFLAHGWETVQAEALRCHTGLSFDLLAKHCTAGERYVLRCNKYTPPFPIVALAHTTPIQKTGAAVLDIPNSTGEDLVASPPDSDGAWALVPRALQGGRIYSVQSDDGIAAFDVVQPGRVYVAGNFSLAEDAHKEAFLADGWVPVPGLEIVRHDATRHQIFTRTVSAGEHCRIRSSLFRPPHIILYGP